MEDSKSDLKSQPVNCFWHPYHQCCMSILADIMG